FQGAISPGKSTAISDAVDDGTFSRTRKIITEGNLGAAPKAANAGVVQGEAAIKVDMHFGSGQQSPGIKIQEIIPKRSSDDGLPGRVIPEADAGDIRAGGISIGGEVVHMQEGGWVDGAAGGHARGGSGHGHRAVETGPGIEIVAASERLVGIEQGHIGGESRI